MPRPFDGTPTRQVIAQWEMPVDLMKICGVEKVLFRVVMVFYPNDVKQFAVEVAQSHDAMGNPVWASAQFPMDQYGMVLLHSAASAIASLREQLASAQSDLVSKQLYVDALEQELASKQTDKRKRSKG